MACRAASMRHFFCTIAAIALPTLAVVACSDSPRPPDVRFLASDLHVAIAGQPIVIPAVALRGPGHVFDLNRRKPGESLKERFESEARDPNNPMPMDKLDILIRQYQYTGEHVASRNICPLLSRKWSQALCTGQHRGILARLPEKFDLMDRSKLHLLQNTWTVGKERRCDQIKDFVLRPGVTDIGCDKASRFCTALVEVLPGLVAVWTVWSDDKTGAPAEQMAHSQGAAIVQFVRRALSPVEDATLVDEV